MIHEIFNIRINQYKVAVFREDIINTQYLQLIICSHT